MKKSSLLTLAMVALFVGVAASCGDAPKKDSKETASISEMPSASAAEGDTQAKFARMSFDKVEHDFGAIAAGMPQETVFTFKNIGDAPLLITNARSSCGCTVPDYPRNTPIAPGETGELLVKFNGTGVNGTKSKLVFGADGEGVGGRGKRRWWEGSVRGVVDAAKRD